MYWFQNILSNQYLVRDFTGCYEVVVSKCTAFLRSRSCPPTWTISHNVVTVWLCPPFWAHLPSKAGIYLSNCGICCPFPIPSDINVQLTLGNGDRRQTQHVPFQPRFESLLLKISECIKYFPTLHPNSSLRCSLHINKTLPSIFTPTMLFRLPCSHKIKNKNYITWERLKTGIAC